MTESLDPSRWPMMRAGDLARLIHDRGWSRLSLSALKARSKWELQEIIRRELAEEES